MKYPGWAYPIIIGAVVVAASAIILFVVMLATKYIIEPFDRWLNK